jgi:hypothetical protein
VLDLQAGHREVLRVAGRKTRSRRERCRSDEAVRLSQSDTARCEVASPVAREFSFSRSERHRANGLEQAANRINLVGPGASPHLLHIDRADERGRFGRAQRAEAFGGRSLAKDLDQHGGIEEQNGSAHPPRIPSPLFANPRRRIAIPVVSFVVDRPDRGEDVVPAALIIKGAPEYASNEGAAPSLPDPLVQFRHQLIVEAYV